MEKLIRFDWAIKQLLRNKANFDILEGFLSAMLHEDVTVVNLLESESNQEDGSDKFNRVDLLVENANQELILIEVQVEPEYDFFHRMAYGAAKLVSEYLEKGQAYKHIKKVISVNVTYFNLGVGDDYVYYGSTNFIGIHSHDELTLSKKQSRLFGTPEVKKIFPEYYLIRVGKFPDEVHEALDEWIYMIKHSEVKPEFTAKHIQDASERLRVMNLGEAQRKAYEEYMQSVSYHESMLWSSHEEGRVAEKVETVRKSLQHGLELSVIANITDLTIAEIQQIRQQLREEGTSHTGSAISRPSGTQSSSSFVSQ